MRHAIVVTLAACGLAAGSAAFAQTPNAPAKTGFPSKPVRIMVGFVPGGGVDLAARLVAQGLTDLWGVSTVVDNRGGAAGGIATEITARAAPDGYTVMLCQIASHAITPARFPRLPYDHIRDFSFPVMIGATPNVLMVHPSQPIKGLQDYIAFARANPGKMSFGSSGVGASPHLSIELLKTMTGINIVHVPYKGAAAALGEVMGGQIPSSVGNLPGGPLAAIKAGRVRAVGVTSGKRSPQAPDVPTFAEQGVPGYDVASWYGICGPAGIPKAILTRLTSDLFKVLAGPTRQKLEEQGIDVAPAGPAEFVAHVRVETEKWRKVVKDAGLVGDQ